MLATDNQCIDVCRHLDTDKELRSLFVKIESSNDFHRCTFAAVSESCIDGDDESAVKKKQKEFDPFRIRFAVAELKKTTK